MTSHNSILVTGGAGYVGSHLCKALAAQGDLPVTYDNLSRGHERAVKWGPLEKGDLNDKERLRHVMRQHSPKAVVHFAGYTDVAESVADPGLYYLNNVAGTLSLLDVMSEDGIDAVVFSSTCGVYGYPETVPIPESHPLRPINPYGASKLMIEQMLSDFGTAKRPACGIAALGEGALAATAKPIPGLQTTHNLLRHNHHISQ